MAIVGLEWLFIWWLIIIVVVAWLYLRRRNKKRMIARALAVIRSKRRVSIDDLIIYGMIPPDSIEGVIGELLSKGLIRIEQEDGKIFYATL